MLSFSGGVLGELCALKRNCNKYGSKDWTGTYVINRKMTCFGVFTDG